MKLSCPAKDASFIHCVKQVSARHNTHGLSPSFETKSLLTVVSVGLLKSSPFRHFPLPSATVHIQVGHFFPIFRGSVRCPFPLRNRIGPSISHRWKPNRLLEGPPPSCPARRAIHHSNTLHLLMDMLPLLHQHSRVLATCGPIRRRGVLCARRPLA